MSLERPIFIVGHARGGSTLLSGIVNWHSHVGPRHKELLNATDCNTFLNGILSVRKHIKYSEMMEQKNIWFDYFSGRDVFLHMGNELLTERVPASVNRDELVSRLTANFRERRFLSKSPTNSFRVQAIRGLFPDAKIVGICRRGGPVIASWGRRHYGFGKPVDWGSTQIERLGYLQGIKIFARKWQETLDYLAKQRHCGAVNLYSYRELTTAPAETLSCVFRDIELPVEPYLQSVDIRSSATNWRWETPKRYWWFVRLLSWRGNQLIRSIENSNALLPVS